MTYQPGDPARAQQLLAALAAAPGGPTVPDGPATPGWVTELLSLTSAIAAAVAGPDGDTTRTDGASGLGGLRFEQVLGWRNELDRLLGGVANEDPALWVSARTPGTWLDSLLRLRVVLAHVVSKAYWSNSHTIPFGEIEVERYLWGARS